MSLPALLEPATRELLEISVSEERLTQLAERLGLTLEQIAPYLQPQERDAERWLHEIVKHALQLVHGNCQQSNHTYVQRLARIRVFFETANAWEFADKPFMRSKLLGRLWEIHARFAQFTQPSQYLGQSERLPPELADQIWRLDGDFHRALFEAAGSKHLAKIVNLVLDRLREIGAPNKLTDVRETYSEHEELIAALEAGTTDDDAWRVFQAIFQHVENAYRRWFAKEGAMPQLEMDEVSLRWIERLKASASPEREHAEVAFDEQLPALLRDYPGQWVAFHGKELVAVAATQSLVYRRCLALGKPAREVVIRRVVPPVTAEADVFAS